MNALYIDTESSVDLVFAPQEQYRAEYWQKQDKNSCMAQFSETIITHCPFLAVYEGQQNQQGFSKWETTHFQCHPAAPYHINIEEHLRKSLWSVTLNCKQNQKYTRTLKSDTFFFLSYAFFHFFPINKHKLTCRYVWNKHLWYRIDTDKHLYSSRNAIYSLQKTHTLHDSILPHNK